FILKDPIRFNQRVGMFISLIGVIFVVTHGSLEMLLRLKIAFGDWITMAANICWALYGVLGRRYLKNSKPLMTTAATMLVGSLVLIAFSFYGSSVTPLLHQTWQVYTALIYMAVFGSVLAYLFWNYGIAKLGAGNTSLFFNLVPIFTVFISMLMGQPISALEIFGGSVVILGVLISANFIKLPIKKVSELIEKKG
ncbi:MAG: DMT family transporter, partial [Gammaproteobacteria bacterium]